MALVHYTQCPLLSKGLNTLWYPVSIFRIPCRRRRSVGAQQCCARTSIRFIRRTVRRLFGALRAARWLMLCKAWQATGRYIPCCCRMAPRTPHWRVAPPSLPAVYCSTA